MMVLEAQIAPSDEAVLRKWEKTRPDWVRAAYGLAASSAAKALFGVMKSPRGQQAAKYGVAKFESRQPFTRTLHGGKPTEFFGQFAPHSGDKWKSFPYFVSYMSGDKQIIGWPDKGGKSGSLSEFLGNLQEANSHALDAATVRALYAQLHNTGNDGVKVPASYNRPERSLIEPFGARLGEVYAGWVAGNFKAMEDGRIKPRVSGSNRVSGWKPKSHHSSSSSGGGNAYARAQGRI